MITLQPTEKIYQAILSLEPKKRQEALAHWRNALRNLAVDSLYLLSREVLGYDLITEHPHKAITEFIQTWNKRKKLLLLPRGSLKTTIATISYSIQRILQTPNVRILIASETLNQAIKFLSEIKGHFESARFQSFYGDLRRGTGWKESEITVSSRKQNRKEPTISTAGIDVTRTGMHYDLIIVDDCHSQKNTTNSEQIEQVKNWYRLLLSMLEPTGHIMVVGTRWDFNDLYATIQNEMTEEYDIMVRKAVENGKLFFPSRLTQEFLEAQRKEQGEFIYSAQYDLNPIPTSLQTFKESDIRFYDEVPDNLTVYMACDPSLTEEEKGRGDYTAIAIVGISDKNDWYILDLINEHLSPDQINQKLFELYRYWGTLVIGIESVVFSKLLKPSFEKYVWAKGFNPRVEELKSGGRSKELRIKSLQPLYEQHKIFMPKPDFINNDVWPKLYEQLLHFPRSKWDDAIDALSYVNQLAQYKTAQPERTEIERKIQERIKRDRQRNISNPYVLQ